MSTVIRFSHPYALTQLELAQNLHSAHDRLRRLGSSLVMRPVIFVDPQGRWHADTCTLALEHLPLANLADLNQTTATLSLCRCLIDNPFQLFAYSPDVFAPLLSGFAILDFHERQNRYTNPVDMLLLIHHIRRIDDDLHHAAAWAGIGIETIWNDITVPLSEIRAEYNLKLGSAPENPELIDEALRILTSIDPSLEPISRDVLTTTVAYQTGPLDRGAGTALEYLLTETAAGHLDDHLTLGGKITLREGTFLYIFASISVETFAHRNVWMYHDDSTLRRAPWWQYRLRCFRDENSSAYEISDPAIPTAVQLWAESEEGTTFADFDEAMKAARLL